MVTECCSKLRLQVLNKPYVFDPSYPDPISRRDLPAAGPPAALFNNFPPYCWGNRYAGGESRFNDAQLVDRTEADQHGRVGYDDHSISVPVSYRPGLPRSLSSQSFLKGVIVRPSGRWINAGPGGPFPLRAHILGGMSHPVCWPSLAVVRSLYLPAGPSFRRDVFSHDLHPAVGTIGAFARGAFYTHQIECFQHEQALIAKPPGFAPGAFPQLRQSVGEV